MVYCLVCDYDVKESIETHISLYHPLICAVCDLGVGDESDLQSHIDTYHPGVHMG